MGHICINYSREDKIDGRNDAFSTEANRQKQEKKQRNLAQSGRQVRIAGAFLLLIMLLLLSLIWSACSGSVSVPIMEFLQELREPKLRGMAWTIIWEIRLPRALAALILGGALALSGYLLQTFFHNPIAGPFVLGISSGSKLLVALVMVGFLEWNITINSGMLVAAAFAGALLSMLFVLLVARKMEQMAMLIVGGDDRLYLLSNHGFCCDLRQRCGYCQLA